MSDTRNWADTCQETVQTMESMARAIKYNVGALAMLFPNSPVTKDLEYVSERLFEQAKILQEAASKKAVEDFNQAREQSGLLLKATLAGCLKTPTAVVMGTAANEWSEEKK